MSIDVHGQTWAQVTRLIERLRDKNTRICCTIGHDVIATERARAVLEVLAEIESLPAKTKGSREDILDTALIGD